MTKNNGTALTRREQQGIVSELEAKEQTRQRIAHEIQEMMRERVPQFCNRLKKTLAKRDRGPGDVLHKAIASTIIENRALTGGILLRQIGAAHLKRLLHRHMVDRISGLGVIPVDETVEELRQTAIALIPLYPKVARPPLPRRSDLSRMLGRFCGCTRNL